MTSRQMVTSLILDAFGGHQAAWLTAPRSSANPSTDIAHFVDIAQRAEKAKLDFVFVADFPAIPDGSLEQLSRSAVSMSVLEPATLLTALAMSTKHIGVLGTASTSYYEPYNVARLWGSLDHISGGRAGLNVVTTRSRSASFNFGKDDLDEHDTRYERADEFVEVLNGLWDSWDDDAFIRDYDEVRFFDPTKLHTLDHKGKFFNVRGPLNLSRSAQGRPVISQAGGSEAGKELAAKTADVVFINAPTLEFAQNFYADLKGRLAKFGRQQDELKIVSGLTIVTGSTQEEAERRTADVSRHIHPEIGRQMISGVLDTDLSDVDYDSRIPQSKILDNVNKGQTYFGLIRKFVEEGRTLREIAAHFAEARVGSIVKGTPEQIADKMQAWFEARGSDGFMMRAMTVPGNLDDICEEVIPELRRRGLVRTEYTGDTLRENLGLDVAPSRYLGRIGA
ncbi:LLM class flavin-dependent oxidoreductase [Novosphingobium colocasiae]|uniref:Monooxygenase n=1 Tax=Novosphingobium colocasiae TaxID=1256513 RepID=A0A918UHY4_9SPHN|nr:LLM class flavin-dependent oxidoreductase [Novosphingobium colocasiae]GGZ11251.1 monooxygenase [Novosphingobium colocasiae]